MIVANFFIKSFTLVVVAYTLNQSEALAIRHDVSISVESIANRDLQKKRNREAFVELKFVNNSTTDISIPFFRLVGREPKEVYKNLGVRKNNTKYTIVGAKHRDTTRGGDCCAVKYWWTDQKNKLITCGKYDLIAPDLKIGSRHENFQFISAKVPPNPGTYKLSIFFDNRYIEPAAQSYNDSDPDFETAYLQSEIHANIIVSEGNVLETVK